MQSFHCTRGTHKKVWRPYSPWDLPQYERQQLDLNKRMWSVSVCICDLIAYNPSGLWETWSFTLPLTSFHCSPVCISIIATGYSNGPAKASWHRLRFWCPSPFLFLRILETGEVRGDDRKVVPRCFFFSRHQLDKLLLFPLRVLRFIGSGVMRLKGW